METKLPSTPPDRRIAVLVPGTGMSDGVTGTNGPPATLIDEPRITPNPIGTSHVESAVTTHQTGVCGTRPTSPSRVTWMVAGDSQPAGAAALDAASIGLAPAARHSTAATAASLVGWPAAMRAA